MVYKRQIATISNDANQPYCKKIPLNREVSEKFRSIKLILQFLDIYIMESKSNPKKNILHYLILNIEDS